MNTIHPILESLFGDIERAGFSVAAVCRRANVAPSLVSRWKSGSVEPRLSSIHKLEAALELMKAEK